MMEEPQDVDNGVGRCLALLGSAARWAGFFFSIYWIGGEW